MDKKLKDKLSRRSFIAAAATAPLALAVFPIGAQDPIPPPGVPPEMGTIGVAAGQRLGVSVFYHAEIPPTPCNFRMDVLGTAGELLGQHQGQVLDGTGKFVVFDVAANLRKPERKQVHVMVTALGGEHLEATAEVFDERTGVTKIPDAPCLIPHAESPRDPASSVGITRDQAVRISVFHHPSPNQIPCDLIVAILDLDGNVLAVMQGSVLPGQGFDVDWREGSPGFPNLAAGERLQIHVNVQAAHPDEVGMTGEVYDPKTGATAFTFIPCDLVPTE